MVLLLNYFLSKIHTNTHPHYIYTFIWKLEAYQSQQTYSEETMRVVAIYSLVVICKQVLWVAAIDSKLRSTEENAVKQLTENLAEKLGVSRQYLEKRARNRRSVAQNDVDMLRTLGLDTDIGEEMLTLTGDFGKESYAWI